MEERRRYLELTSDVVFKEFMMSDNTKEFKADLIHAITKIPVNDLLKATYSSKELVGKHKEDKVYRTDIIVEIKNKNILVIEMNKEFYEGIMAKTHQYSSRILSEELEMGDNYVDIKEVIEISFNEFKIFEHNKIINELAIVNLGSGKVVDEMNWRGYQIDLKVVEEKCYNDDEKEIVDLFKIFSNNEEVINDLKGKNKNMDKALNELERISSDEKILGLYDVEKVERKIYNSKMKTAEKKGIEQGIENVALNMIKNNVNIKEIILYTGLNENQINKLKESLK